MNLVKQNLHGSKNQWHTFAEISLLRISFVCTVHLDTIKVYLLIIECTIDCLKNNTKSYSKIAQACFGAVTPSSGSALSMLAGVTHLLKQSIKVHQCMIKSVMMWLLPKLPTRRSPKSVGIISYWLTVANYMVCL
jgi:hypothetical protein